jgi:methyltransferase (TIGR00027 family)
MLDNGLPSRTAVLTAAARAFGSREPDASVRNPDSLAGRLIGPAELALIADHPIGRACDRAFDEAMGDPEVFGFTWLMLVRTRCIDAWMRRAIEQGATQLVVLGAGFDSRAHRFKDILRDVAVHEVDHPATQAYKRRRVESVLGPAAAGVRYAPADFAQERVSDVLRRAGVDRSRRTYFICEGLSMYVPEDGIRQTLSAIAEFAPGSAVMLEYLNRGGIDVMMKYPSGTIRNAIDWGEPFVFGVPDGQDREFFANVGLDLGEALKIGSPESVRRYAMRADGTHYGAHLAKAFEQRRQAALAAMDDAGREQAMRAAASSGYWLAELRT